MTTNFLKKCSILAELYSLYGDDTTSQFAPFVEFNDIGLPLAFFVEENLAAPTDDGMRYISQTFDLFLSGLDLDDVGFDNLTEILMLSGLEEV
jgi:hypothetical protein